MANITTLERGDIYFFYRPKVQSKNATEASPKGIKDIQHFYIVLHPYGKTYYRLLIVGRKRLPQIGIHEKSWAFVDTVTRQPKKLKETFKAHIYSTQTRSERKLPEARPCGEGVYGIASADKNTYLVYQLELPREPQTVQNALHIVSEASYVISVKNQTIAGSSSNKTATFSKRLQDKFHNRRFIPLNPPSFLNYAGAEVLLIGVRKNLKKKLGTDLGKEQENLETAEIFNDLKLWKNEKTLKPLFEGQWA